MGSGKQSHTEEKETNQGHLLDELEALLNLLPAGPSVQTRSRHVCVFCPFSSVSTWNCIRIRRFSRVILKWWRWRKKKNYFSSLTGQRQIVLTKKLLCSVLTFSIRFQLIRGFFAACLPLFLASAFSNDDMLLVPESDAKHFVSLRSNNSNNRADTG